MLTERDLIEIGFVRTDVSAEESGDEAFYYYSWEASREGFCVISCDSNCDFVRDTGKWYAVPYDYPDVRIYDAQGLRALVGVISFAVKNRNPYVSKADQKK